MADGKNERVAGWPPWARVVVSGALLMHIAAVLAGAFAAPPASDLEREIAGWFSAYHQAFDQGYAYRYYAPEPGPTPVVTATIHYNDGRPDETVRIPERGVLPRLRYQRQLALANHLMTDFEAARRGTGDGERSHYARSYARFLGKSRPGAESVSLHLLTHLIPNVMEVREALEHGDTVDLDAEEFYTAPERIGVFPCDAS